MCPDHTSVGALLTSCPQLTSLLEALPSALCVVDDIETVIYVKTSAQAVTGNTKCQLACFSKKADHFSRPLEFRAGTHLRH